MTHLFNAIRLLWRAEVHPSDTAVLYAAIEELRAEIAEREAAPERDRQRPAPDPEART